jgi:hypothetical protein
MQRGAGNKIKNSYKRRSPLREPISTILGIVSAVAGAANKSNKKAQAHGEQGVSAGIKTPKFGDTGGGAKVKPMKGL